MNDTPAAQNIHCSNHKMAEEIAPAELCIVELGFDVEVIEGNFLSNSLQEALAGINRSDGLQI